jgi:hypothetical protein
MYRVHIVMWCQQHLSAFHNIVPYLLRMHINSPFPHTPVYDSCNKLVGDIWYVLAWTIERGSVDLFTCAQTYKCLWKSGVGTRNMTHPKSLCQTAALSDSHMQHACAGEVPGVKRAAVRKLLHELGIPPEQLPSESFPLILHKRVFPFILHSKIFLEMFLQLFCI